MEFSAKLWGEDTVYGLGNTLRKTFGTGHIRETDFGVILAPFTV